MFGAILCCTVVLYPVGLGFFQIARFLLTPFSSALVTRKELDLVRPEERSTAAAAFSTVITILYFPFGLIAAAGALFAMIGEFLSIIGIPCGIVWFKALPAIFMPVDRICVPKAVADEIARIKAGDTVRRYKGETGEPETHSAERHFTEDPGETLPPMPEVRQYDDESCTKSSPAPRCTGPRWSKSATGSWRSAAEARSSRRRSGRWTTTNCTRCSPVRSSTPRS